MECPNCYGTGLMTCRFCRGKCSITEMNPDYIPFLGYAIPETHSCYFCSGSGKETCSYCGGTGEIPDQN